MLSREQAVFSLSRGRVGWSDGLPYLLRLGPQLFGIADQEGFPLFSALTRLLRADDGATAIEYGLIVALVAVAIIGGLQTVGSSLNAVFYQVASAL